jgi:hypothetical protein
MQVPFYLALVRPEIYTVGGRFGGRSLRLFKERKSSIYFRKSFYDFLNNFPRAAMTHGIKLFNRFG